MIMHIIECFHTFAAHTANKYVLQNANCSTYLKHGYWVCPFIHAQALIFATIQYASYVNY